MKIPFLDLKRENKPYALEMKQAVSRVIDSGWYIMGKEKEQFEKEFASYCGVNYCIGTGNGLDALRLILMAYIELGELQCGDEVILPANSFIATALAVSQCGLKPVFADCNAHTYNLDPISVSEKISSKTKAVIAVHLYGQVAPMDSLTAITEQFGLKLIEDAAQAHGAIYKGRKAGNLSHAAAFSFYPVKNLGAIGDAGAVTTNDEQLAKMIKCLSDYGSEGKYINKYIGINSRLDELQAAVLSVKLKYLDTENNKRRKIALCYSKNIKNKAIVLPEVLTADSHVFHQYVIRTKFRDELQAYLSAYVIHTQIHYPIAINKQEAYKGYDNTTITLAEKYQDEVLSLPIYPSLTQDEVHFIIEILNKWKIQ